MNDSSETNREFELAELLQKMCELGDDVLPDDFDKKLDQLSEDELGDLLGAGHCLNLLDGIRAGEIAAETPIANQTLGGSDDTVPKQRVRRDNAIPDQLGRYKIIRLAARGGFAEIYQARDLELNRQVALKVPLPDRLESDSAKERFQREGRAVATLSHPAIVPVYEASKSDGFHFIAFQWVPGDNLQTYLQKQTGPVPPNEAAAAIERIADALVHAHSREILHRDIKPANLLLDQDELKDKPWHDCIRITDFGLAKDISEATSLNALTLGGSILGTPAYMSPEQVRAEENLGPTTDVYSLGTVLYELMTGDPPHKHETYSATLRAIETDQPAPISSSQRPVPKDLEAICEKCLSKQASQRYQTAYELKQDLERFRNGLPVTAKKPGTLNLFARWVKRNPVVGSSLALTFLSLVAGICGTTIMWNRSLNSQEDLRKQVGIMQSIFEDLDDSTDGAVIGEVDLRTRMAQRMIESAESIAQSTAEEPLRSSLLSTLGRTLVVLGHPDQGHNVIANAIELANGKLSDDHLFRLKVNLANATAFQGKYPEAADMLDEIIERGLASTTIPDREKLDALGIIAESRFAANQFEQAAQQFRRLLLLVPEMNIEETYIDRIQATADFRLASIAFWNESDSKSLDAMHDAHDRFVTNFPPDHRDVIAAGYGMCSALRSQKRYNKALEIAENCFAMATSSFGSADFATIQATDALLIVCGQNSSNAKFRKRMLELLPIAEKNCQALIANVGLKHPDAILFYGNVSTAYGLAGDLDKCIEITRELVAIAEKHLGRKNPVTQTQIFGLALALKESGKHGEAIGLLKEFIAAAESGTELAKAKISQAHRELRLSTDITTAQGSMPNDGPGPLSHHR